MKLSVVILNYNVRYFLELCIKSVQAAIVNIDAEIIIVDNNSKDDSVAMLKDKFPEFKLIVNKENLGFSKANNIGVQQAKGEYVCILNPDTVVAEDTFTKILNFAHSKSKLGALGCQLINGVGDFLPESKRKIPYVKAAFKKILGNAKEYYAENLKPDEVGEVEVLVGAFMFMKRDVFLKVGGFDEDYFMYGEDIDLSYKLLKAGYKNYYFGQTTIIHYKGESTLKNKFYARRFYEAMRIFYKKHFKRNLLFDVFVCFGINLAYFFRKPSERRHKVLNRYVLLSDTKNKNLESHLDAEVVLVSNTNNLQNGDEVIIDASKCGYKEIISIIKANPKNKRLAFKILPENSKFIIGSDNTIDKGEIIEFN